MMYNVFNLGSLYKYHCSFEELKGHTVVGAYCDTSDDGYIQIKTLTHLFHIWHDQDCCEDVHIESIVGDLKSMVGQVIQVADEVVKDNHNEDLDIWIYDDSATWTFYKLATVKGWVDIRWVGSSNGYYSESVDVVKIPLEDLK